MVFDAQYTVWLYLFPSHLTHILWYIAIFRSIAIQWTSLCSC